MAKRIGEAARTEREAASTIQNTKNLRIEVRGGAANCRYARMACTGLPLVMAIGRLPGAIRRFSRDSPINCNTVAP
jgi:hypothetical protein